MPSRRHHYTGALFGVSRVFGRGGGFRLGRFRRGEQKRRNSKKPDSRAGRGYQVRSP